MSASPHMDAVIAWVDGSDPAHHAKRMAAMREAGLVDGDANFLAPTRFSDLGEIYYCIASILKYAPFIRHIYVLGDAQQPANLDEFARQNICAPDRIRFVDHRDLFRGYESYLPTFNSRTLESMFWNIEDAAEYLLYFNDDFFLNGPVEFANYVGPDGTLLLEGGYRSATKAIWKHRIRRWRYRLMGKGIVPTRYKMAQALAADLLGKSRYFALEHVPHPLRTRTLADYFDAHPEALRHQLSYKFRAPQQFLPYALSNEIELMNGRAKEEKNRATVYLTPSDRMSQDELLRLLGDTRLRSGCIQSLDEFPEERRTQLRAAMAEKLKGYLPEGIDWPDQQV
ncbi:Stealth CR1 domain-containing protein [Thioclava indica]|nr:Stealth CR1 domain-containing protein [Thioclava indica]